VKLKLRERIIVNVLEVVEEEEAKEAILEEAILEAILEEAILEEAILEEEEEEEQVEETWEVVLSMQATVEEVPMECMLDDTKQLPICHHVDRSRQALTDLFYSLIAICSILLINL